MGVRSSTFKFVVNALTMSLVIGCAILAGCGPREQTETLPLSMDRHEDEITNRYRTLGDLAIDHLGGARVELDRYCEAMGTSHHTNITVLSCGYDFHAEAWIGNVLIESTCIFGDYKANFSRELEFKRPAYRPKNYEQKNYEPKHIGWSEARLKSSNAVFVNDPPMVVRDILEKFDDILSKHYPTDDDSPTTASIPIIQMLASHSSMRTNWTATSCNVSRERNDENTR